MQDISAKNRTPRTAVARGALLLRPETLRRIRENELPKPDALPTARAAGLLAAKRTSDLIPHCHPIALTHVDLAFAFREPDRIEVTATVRTEDRTGVEMEALTAVSLACLTLYDMAKGIDPGIRITEIALVSKTGGKSDFHAA